MTVLIGQPSGKSRRRERSRDDKRIVDIVDLELASRSRMRLASASGSRDRIRDHSRQKSVLHSPFFGRRGRGGSAKGRAAAISASVLANAAHLNFSNSPAFHFPDGRCLVRPRLLRAPPFLRPSRPAGWEKGEKGEGARSGQSPLSKDSRKLRRDVRPPPSPLFFSPFPLSSSRMSLARIVSV
jgi:hypothetical protein